jgi:hypothetical protein
MCDDWESMSMDFPINYLFSKYNNFSKEIQSKLKGIP